MDLHKLNTYVDVKSTIWERIYISKDCAEKIKKMSKEGTTTGEIMFEVNNDSICSEILDDTIDYMDTMDNDNQTTIQLYENDDMNEIPLN